MFVMWDFFPVHHAEIGRVPSGLPEAALKPNTAIQIGDPVSIHRAVRVLQACDGVVEEVILATGFTAEGELTAHALAQALKARGHGTLCFYGAPGTGKTALAEHIARALERPLIIKQASDLMSKFVGETEQNMAAMFREAESEKAVLLLDEADSFLQDRRGAQRTYEVTEVNEMLQGMERFNGIFVCTTNLLDRIDQAALRRFTFKIKFMPLTTPQREKMFITEALAGDAALMTPELRERLARLQQLCPGDFAAVKRQVDILATEFSAAEFLEQLEAEHRIKPEVREMRNIGFVQ